MAKFFTVVIKFDDEANPDIGFKETLLGGEVVGIAAYDAMSALHIAEKALENSYDDSCEEALKAINDVFLNKT